MILRERIKNTHPSSEFVFQDDGGEEVVKSLCADAMETLQLMWRSVAVPLTVPDAKKEQDKLKVPSIGGIQGMGEKWPNIFTSELLVGNEHEIMSPSS